MEQEVGAGTWSRSAEVMTGVTEAGLGKAGLGTQREERGCSELPTPDAQPAFSAPTHPRERPAGDIPPPTPPSPPAVPTRRSRVSQPRIGTRRHREAHGRAYAPKRLRGRPLPTLRPRGGGRVNVKSEPRKVGGVLGCAAPSCVPLTPIECIYGSSVSVGLCRNLLVISALFFSSKRSNLKRPLSETQASSFRASSPS